MSDLNTSDSAFMCVLCVGLLSPAQVEQNAQSCSPGVHPIVLWQQEEEEKAKAAAAAAPVDVKAMMSKMDRKK